MASNRAGIDSAAASGTAILGRGVLDTMKIA
jgi:hypothetical protein